MIFSIQILDLILDSTYAEKEKFWSKSDMSTVNLFTVTQDIKWSRSAFVTSTNSNIVFVTSLISPQENILLHCLSLRR